MKRPRDPAARRQERSGRDHWRSLEELADTDEFRTFLASEFPSHADAAADPVARRDFMRLMGASMALAGLGACTKQPEEVIVPYVQAPEHIVPGKPLFFASAMPVGGYGAGVLVESHMGRPTKIEGNPRHPDSLGATTAQVQAEILSLYDPDRSKTVTHAGWPSTWGKLLAALGPELQVQKLRRGAGVRILTGNVTSPALGAGLMRLRQELPEARWHQWEAAGEDHPRSGALLAFGRPVTPRYDLGNADVVVSLDADFLAEGPASPRLAREAMGRRSAAASGRELNRLYTVQSTPSLTGAVSDHRLVLQPGRLLEAAAHLAAAILGQELATAYLSGWQPTTGETAGWIGHAAADLAAHRGRSLVIPGLHQPPVVHALAHAMNARLGNVGNTVTHLEPVEAEPVNHVTSLRQLVTDMNDGAVDLLVILDTNPVYSAPVDLGFTEALARVRTRVRLGAYEDETSAHCHWHVPETHALESWGDLRASDGTVSIVQPLIAPLYAGRSAHELLAVLLGAPGTSAHTAVKSHWQKVWGEAGFERRWRRALHDGIIPNTASPEVTVTPSPRATTTSVAPSSGLEVVFRPDPHIGDGRYANNGWLQELSKPLTKLTWDNAALLSPATAAELGVANEDVVALDLEGREVEAPVWILPGQADNTVTLHLGYGRVRAGRVGDAAGFDAYRLRTSANPSTASGASVKKTARRMPLASTQHHHAMEGRELVRSTTAPELEQNPRTLAQQGHAPPKGLSLYPEQPAAEVAWGMVIDLGACTGCNACVVACQAENNIPVVGKEEVGRGREMAWLRIDRYYEGEPANPSTYHQPVPCMHCEKAPCEPVCPVGATVHSHEGLNDMVYNRCVGTRYCSNNCPYKVRRFNFFSYGDFKSESLKAQRNPDVTVRTRGVMEKCTYCVQRINQARITAKREGRQIADGEVVTACQQVCPTRAIHFGNIQDDASVVAALRASPLHYSILAELGTEPHTTYLGLVKNPNPELDK